MRIAVISIHGKPLSPTTPAKARKLIKSGGAVSRRDKLGTFYIQLTTPTGETIPHETVVGIDPGKLYSGVGVQTPRATLWMGHLVLPFSMVKKAMESRRRLRRFRRYRQTRRRPIRFRHRTGHKIPPSIKANRELEWRVLHELARIYPITHVVSEVVKARGAKSFSPVMVGQQYRWTVSPKNGLWNPDSAGTARLRLALGLQKTPKKPSGPPRLMLSMASPWPRIIFCITPGTRPPLHTANAGKAPATSPRRRLLSFSIRCGIDALCMIKTLSKAGGASGAGARPPCGVFARATSWKRPKPVGAMSRLYSNGQTKEYRCDRRPMTSPRAISGLKPPSLAAVDTAVGRGHAVRALLTSAITAFLPPSRIFARHWPHGSVGESCRVFV